MSPASSKGAFLHGRRCGPRPSMTSRAQRANVCSLPIHHSLQSICGGGCYKSIQELLTFHKVRNFIQTAKELCEFWRVSIAIRVYPSGIWWRFIPGGALPYKPIRDVPFFRVSFFSINSWTGYENWSEIPKRVMTICSRTKGYCFQEHRLLFSLLFCNLKIPKQGIKMQIFFLNGLWRLKKWAPPRQVTFKCPPRALHWDLLEIWLNSSAKGNKTQTVTWTHKTAVKPAIVVFTYTFHVPWVVMSYRIKEALKLTPLEKLNDVSFRSLLCGNKTVNEVKYQRVELEWIQFLFTCEQTNCNYNLV